MRKPWIGRGHHFHVEHALGVSTVEGSQPELLANIDEALNVPRPVGIEYLESQFEPRNGADQDFHASTLVGRQFNEQSGQCEYLIRNSRGTSCASYASRYKCEGGNVWIPQSDLLNSIIRV